MKTLLIFFVTQLISMVSICQSNVDFTPIPCSSINDAKETIRKIYTSQKEEAAPNKFEVTDDYVSYGKQKKKGSFMSIGLTTVQYENTYYFDLISDLWLRHAGGHYYIVIKCKSMNSSSKLNIFDEKLAIEGYSAIKCMIDKKKQDAQTTTNPDKK